VTRPVVIELPDQASDTAHAVVPAEHVPRVAAALRASRSDVVDERDDETYVADCVVDYLMRLAASWSHRERIKQALRDAEQL